MPAFPWTIIISKSQKEMFPDELLLAFFFFSHYWKLSSYLPQSEKPNLLKSSVFVQRLGK